MEDRRLQFWVGLVVLLGIAVGALLIFFVSDGPIWPIGGDQYQVNIHFPQASGVSPGTPVRKFGKLIGRVDEVKLVEDGVLVTISIDNDQKLPVTDVPEVTASLIGGDAVINFVSRRPRENAPEEIPPPEALPAGNGSASLPRFHVRLVAFHQPVQQSGTIQPGQTIEGNVRPSPVEILIDMQDNLERTIESLGTAGDAVASVANRVDSILADADMDRIRRIVGQTEQALAGFTTTMQSLNNILGDELLQSRLRSGIEGLPLAIEDVRATMQRIEQAAAAAENNLKNLEGLTGPLGDQGPEIAENLRNASGNLSQLLAQVADVTKSFNTKDGTLGKLINNPQLYDDVSRTVLRVEEIVRQLRPIVENLQTFSNKIARDPSRIGAGGIIRREAPIR